jgi:large subunit ribosomal protein L21
MFAVVECGGKQYKVAENDIIFIEKLEGNGKVEFNDVLMLGDKIGSPYVEGAKVTGQILEQKKGDKVLVFKKKRRHNYRRLNGHRQNLTVVKITAIK